MPAGCEYCFIREGESFLLSVGIAGAGVICADHLKAIQKYPGATVRAVADLDEARAKSAAGPFGAAVYADYKEMIACEALDAVVVNLPHSLHEDCTLLCAQKKIHVFVEKPMSVSAESCRRMLDACRSAGVLLQVGHVQRYFPENRAAQEIVRSGRLGKLLMVSDLRTSNYFADTRPAWFLKKSTAGGGILMNFGAHSFDKLRYLTGSRIGEVRGCCASGRPGVEVEGNAQVSVRMENGVSAVISLCGYAVEPTDVTMLYFTAGALKLSTGVGLWQTEGKGYVPVDTSRYPDPFQAQLAEFFDGVLYDRPVPCDGAYGLSVVQAVETVYRQQDRKKEEKS